jgi:hypothetical protein
LSDGTPLGGNFKVNDDSVYSIQDSPSITIDDNGNFVITWQDERNGDWDIYFQRYNSDGILLGNNSRVEDTTESGYQWNPSISSDDAGNFIITWQDRRNVDFDIYAQRYLSDGTAIGGNFKVNDDSVIVYHSSPDISIDESARFLITWTDSRNCNQDIFAQRYLSNGTAYGNNFQLTNMSNGSQLLPTVATMDDKIFTAWQDNRSGQTGYDIWTNVLDWDDIVSAGNNNPSDTPLGYLLYQNYPNPLNPSTVICYQLPVSSEVTLKVYDILGKEIATLVDEYKQLGTHEVEFNATALPSGVYFYQLKAGSFIQTKKMLLLK